MSEVIRILLGFACIYLAREVEGILSKLFFFFWGISFISGNEMLLCISSLLLMVGFVCAGMQKAWNSSGNNDGNGDDGGGE